MFFLKDRSKSYIWAVLVTVILTSFQLVRIIAFVNVYGGIEHDSGWFLSIARSLAEQGTFTTMVSTIVDPQAVGGINIDQKFDIQDSEGRIWFFTGNGNGPASIVPNAIPLKIFGTNFWSLRAGPLIFYTLFLLLAALILYRLAGIWAIILCHTFLFFYPHISIFLSYEAMGEVASMVYILGAYLAFVAATKKWHRRWLHFLLAGLVVGLAINAKLITLWSVSGIFIWATVLWLISCWKRNRELGNDSRWLNLKQWQLTKISFLELILLGVGVPLTLTLWELIHMVILTRLAGFKMYQQQAYQRLKFILDDGSGVGLQLHSGPEFFWDKFFLLQEIAHPQRWVTGLIFIGLFLGGIFLLSYWHKQAEAQDLWVPMWLGWFAHTVWFVGLAKTGWPRHFWFALILAIMLLSVIIVNLTRIGLQRGKEADSSILISKSTFSRPKLRGGGRHPQMPTSDSQMPNIAVSKDAGSSKLYLLSFVSGVGLLILLGWGFLSQPHVWGFYLPDEIVPYWQDKQINHKYGANLPWIIIPTAAQAETVAYLQQLPPDAHIYYPAQHKAAEISALSGRVLYPLKRREHMAAHPQDVVVISPTLIAPWMDPIRREALLGLVREDCPQPILANDYYMICPLVQQ